MTSILGDQLNCIVLLLNIHLKYSKNYGHLEIAIHYQERLQLSNSSKKLGFKMHYSISYWVPHSLLTYTIHRYT